MSNASHHINRLVEHLFRQEAGRMTAILTRIFGFDHSDLVEDIVQDTFITALKTWSFKGQPDNPSAWLIQVAKNNTINAIKKDQKFIKGLPIQAKLDKSAGDAGQVMDDLFLDHEIADSQLRILFACCQPSLSPKSQIALTLKTISGFSNAEIARALLMSEPAVKKMIYRARKSIREEERSFNVPFVDETEERLESARTVCYLMFNEGYKRSEGDRLLKESLCREAIRLTCLLTGMKKGASESAALLSLMLFNVARFPARLDKNGHPIDLEKQDRKLWDKDLIQKGFYYMSQARQSKILSRYHLEAGIASIHCMAQSYPQTDWQAIVNYYRRLVRMVDNPVVKLNYAIALSNLEGPEAGLNVLDESELQKPLDQYFLLYAAKADMYFRMQDYKKAKMYYQLAMDLSEAESDRHYLSLKIKNCDLKSISEN